MNHLVELAVLQTSSPVSQEPEQALG